MSVRAPGNTFPCRGFHVSIMTTAVPPSDRPWQTRCLGVVPTDIVKEVLGPVYEPVENVHGTRPA